MNIIKKLSKQSRRSNQEQGFTMAELPVAMACMALLMVMTLPVVVGTTKAQANQIAHSQGVGVNSVVDDARAVYASAVQLHTDYPDDIVSKEALEARGYMPDVANDLVWSVGQSSRSTDNAKNTVCSVAYSVSREADKYDRESPVLVNVDSWQVDMNGASLGHDCRGYRGDGTWGYVID